MSDASDDAQVMTLEQTAKYLQISKAHLSNIINSKVSGVPILRHVRVGRRVLIRREWANEWLEELAHGQSGISGLRIVLQAGRN